MNMQMVRRVNENRAWERAAMVTEYLQQSKELKSRSANLVKEGEKFQLDIKKLFSKEKINER